MQKERVRPYFLLILLIAAFFLVAYVFRPFLSTLALAVVFSVVLYPVYKKILTVFRLESLAAIMTILVTAICIVIPLSFIGYQVASESQGLYASFASGDGHFYIDKIINGFEHSISKVLPQFEGVSGGISSDINTYLGKALSWLIDRTGTIFSSLATLGLKAFLFFISLYYLLKDGSKLKKSIIEISPLSDNDDEVVFDKLGLAINSVIKGNLMVALTQGILATGGFIIFGVPNAVLWGTVTAIAALIPGVGTALVIVPTVLFLFITSSPANAIGLLVWGAVAVGLVDNFIGPKLVGRSIQIHPLIVLLAALGGLVFFGPLGIFLGPLAASLFFALLEIYSKSAQISPGTN